MEVGTTNLNPDYKTEVILSYHLRFNDLQSMKSLSLVGHPAVLKSAHSVLNHLKFLFLNYWTKYLSRWCPWLLGFGNYMDGFCYLQQLIQYMTNSDKRGVSANGPELIRPIIGGPVFFFKIEPIGLRITYESVIISHCKSI